ncbi:hypothetical protein COCVIDRAFT_110292 [Bipolaris victoriae FI3]|uniref:Uncharacterized protein n=1 Tax=Bipolaris victoriae (strain FI3) TaxID=930091 RepID=W7E727_BIPV3|nr:hypothetical protein COCVIDRAFT_110292 [Bipolaris victoriae FI3]
MGSHSHPPRKWSLSEDQKLREGVEAQLREGEVKDWCRIADSLPGRTNKDCRKRWHNSVAGGLKKGQWSKSEDDLLARGVEEHGQRWTVIANCVGTRSADQCAKRWQQSLDPNLDRSEWQETDDNELIDAVQQLGRHWKDIQREHFPERSKNDIKNRYTVLVRRYQNQGITLANAPSSPSDCGTPAPFPNYPEDDGYLSPNSAMYDSLLHTPSPRGHRLSWSSIDNDAYSTWSSSQAYTMPTAVADQHIHQSSATLPQYGYTQPPPINPNMPSPWDQTTSYMHPSSPSLHTGGASTNPSIQGYSSYQLAQQPIISRSPVYTAPTAHAPYGTMPHGPPRRTSGQQDYIETTSPMYQDPRNSQYSYYPS